MQRTLLAALACGLSVALAGCMGEEPTEVGDGDGMGDGAGDGTGDGGDTGGGDGADTVQNEATIEAFDYGFDGPESVPAGWTTLTIDNTGEELHQIQLYFLADNHTYGDFQQALASSEGPPPDWIRSAGGPNSADPGNSTVATVNLEEGTYAMVCFIPSPDGTPHVFKGMAGELNVTASEEETQPPETDNTVRLTDYNFTFDPLTAGTHEVEIVNDGDEPHEAALVRLHGNATAMDFISGVEGGENATGPPPGNGAGGLTFIDPGMTATATLDLEPGNYAFICFAHIEQGMISEFEVQEDSGGG